MSLELVSAIVANEFGCIKDLVRRNPRILLWRDESNNTILHLAAHYGSKEIISFILKTLIKRDWISSAAEFNKDGNTALHLAAQFNRFKVIECILVHTRKFGLKSAHTCNNNRKLPLHLVSQNKKQKAKELKKTYILLESVTLNFGVKKLSTLLNVETELKRYPETKENPILKENIQRACALINKTKKYIKHSFNHPQTNRFSLDKVIALGFKVDDLRKKLEGITITNSVELSLYATIIMQNEIANCGQFSRTVCHLFKQMVKQIDLKRMTVIESMELKSPDDHAFNVIDRQRNKDPNDLSGWGANAVAFGAWENRVWLAKEMHSQSIAYYRYTSPVRNRRLTLLGLYNPLCHQLKPSHSLTWRPKPVSIPAVSQTLFSQIGKSTPKESDNAQQLNNIRAIGKLL